MSGPVFARELAAHGVKWNRTTVAKFETGLRNSITVQEMLALAVVLDVPPVWLLIDPVEGVPTPITDDVERDPWQALLWLIGQEPLVDAELPGSTWRGAAGPMSYVTSINQLTYAYRHWMDNTSDLIDGIDIDDSREKRARQILGALARENQKVAALGYRLPSLPVEIRNHAVKLGIDLMVEGD